MPEPYSSIAQVNYERFVSKDLTNQSLRRYFDTCFQAAVDHYGMHSCWSCVECLRNGLQTVRWGNKPRHCPICNSTNVYEVATFQGRAPIVGAAFDDALVTVLKKAFQIQLLPSPPGTRTHDIEIPHRLAIEVKGSPARIANPGGTIKKLDRPGLERSDTQKKAFDNARAFRQMNPKVPFYIVSNAVPSKFVGYWDEHVTGIIDVTKSERLEFLVAQIKQL